MSERLRTSDFDYELPKELIAQRPPANRDDSRLLVVRRESGTIEHRRFPDIVHEFGPGDLLVINDTQVIPARLVGRRHTGGKVEVLLVEPSDPDQRRWSALVKTRGRLHEGETVELGERAALRAARRIDGMTWEVEVVSDDSTPSVLQRIGLPPLPPYIAQDHADQARRAEDLDRYQTVYARRAGAIAAPTAGLHFTDAVLDAIRQRGAQTVAVTLHVGLGTFLPVKTEYLDDHPMHRERFEVPAETAAAISEAQRLGHRVVAVGTTSCRLLETVDWARVTGAVSGETGLFIYPPHQFRCVSALLTNFHLPRSTLLALVAAFAGHDLVRKAYEEAIDRRYRFYSYGDAMFITP